MPFNKLVRILFRLIALSLRETFSLRSPQIKRLGADQA